MSLYPFDPALAMAEVYSLYFPETKDVIRELRTHPDFDDWFDQAWLGRQNDVPTEFLETWRAWSGLPLDTFPHRYVGNGSSEIIRELMQPYWDVRQYKCPAIFTFSGEYEGYSHVCEAHFQKLARCVRRSNDIESMQRNIAYADAFADRPTFWISQPSALDGEYWTELRAFMDVMTERNPECRFVVDASYHGLTRDPQFIPELADPRVSAVIFSLSKVFGLYRWRVGGVFSREPIPGLAYNRYFNSLFGLKVGITLMQRYGCHEIPNRYAHLQRRLVERLIELGQVAPDTQPSNALLLARSATPHVNPKCNRASGFTRICLTPGLHTLITQESK